MSADCIVAPHPDNETDSIADFITTPNATRHDDGNPSLDSNNCPISNTTPTTPQPTSPNGEENDIDDREQPQLPDLHNQAELPLQPPAPVVLTGKQLYSQKLKKRGNIGKQNLQVYHQRRREQAEQDKLNFDAEVQRCFESGLPPPSSDAPQRTSARQKTPMSLVTRRSKKLMEESSPPTSTSTLPSSHKLSTRDCGEVLDPTSTLEPLKRKSQQPLPRRLREAPSSSEQSNTTNLGDNEFVQLQHVPTTPLRPMQVPITLPGYTMPCVIPQMAQMSAPSQSIPPFNAPQQTHSAVNFQSNIQHQQSALQISPYAQPVQFVLDPVSGQIHPTYIHHSFQNTHYQPFPLPIHQFPPQAQQSSPVQHFQVVQQAESKVGTSNPPLATTLQPLQLPLNQTNRIQMLPQQANKTLSLHIVHHHKQQQQQQQQQPLPSAFTSTNPSNINTRLLTTPTSIITAPITSSLQTMIGKHPPQQLQGYQHFPSSQIPSPPSQQPQLSSIKPVVFPCPFRRAV